ncbi:hypothetical protein Leryth_014599 [Lithospermum erythrorhizon]|nr:hypothetical protein Leryth_014599 [Lithospermum erythrorhizon]
MQEDRGKRKKLEEKTFETTKTISKKPNMLQDELNEEQKGKTIASIGEDRTKRKHFEESAFRTRQTVSKKLHMFQDEHNEKVKDKTTPSLDYIVYISSATENEKDITTASLDDIVNIPSDIENINSIVKSISAAYLVQRNNLEESGFKTPAMVTKNQHIFEYASIEKFEQKISKAFQVKIDDIVYVSYESEKNKEVITCSTDDIVYTASDFEKMDLIVNEKLMEIQKKSLEE